jgi:stage V sporulation protein B
LAVATVVIKILGSVYKIFLGNILGDSGYALFYAAYSIFSVFLAISTTGLPIALSKMVSEAKSLKRPKQVKKIYRVAYITFVALGTVCFLTMFLFADSFATLMKNPDIVYCIRVLSPSILLLCLISAYRGLFQGLSDMRPTAVSQVIEVAVKVVIGLGFAIWLKSFGCQNNITSAGAILGTTTGSLASFIFLFVIKKKSGKEIFNNSSSEEKTDKSSVIFKRLIRISIPVLLGSSVLSFTMFIDNFQIMNKLQTVAGFSYEEAKILYGAFSKAFTIMNLPPAFVVPLSLSLIPAVSSRLALKDRIGAAKIGVSSLRITAALSLPAGIGLGVLAKPIIETLYPNTNESAIPILSLLGIAAFFLSIALLTNSILQAYGNFSIPIYTMLAGGVVKIIINYVLVADPQINIIGASIGVIACYAVISTLNIIAITKLMPQLPNFYQVFIKPTLASALMGVGVYACYPLIYNYIGIRLFSEVRISVAFSMLLSIE